MTEKIEVEVREENCSGVSMWSVCINHRHVWRFETSRDATRLAVSIQRALRAATPPRSQT